MTHSSCSVLVLNHLEMRVVARSSECVVVGMDSARFAWRRASLVACTMCNSYCATRLLDRGKLFIGRLTCDTSAGTFPSPRCLFSQLARLRSQRLVEIMTFSSYNRRHFLEMLFQPSRHVSVSVGLFAETSLVDIISLQWWSFELRVVCLRYFSQYVLSCSQELCVNVRL